MSKRFYQINKKDFDEFNEAEENQNTKRKTELDVNLIHSCIASEAALHVNRPQRMEELTPSELDTCTGKVNGKRLLSIVFTVNTRYIFIKRHFVLKL